MTQVHHSDPFSQNLPKVIFSDTFVKNKHLSLLNNVYITWKLDLAPFQGLSVDKTWFCSLHPPCGQDSVGPLEDRMNGIDIVSAYVKHFNRSCKIQWPNQQSTKCASAYLSYIPNPISGPTMFCPLTFCLLSYQPGLLSLSWVCPHIETSMIEK